MSKLIPLPQLPSELQKLTGAPGPGYRRLYNLALDGRLPVERRNGRLFARRADLSKIAEVLDLTVPSDRVAA